MNYTITLSNAELKAMHYITKDPQEWIDNVVHDRARIAIDEICKIYTNYKLDNNEPIIVVGRDEMVVAAYEEGIVKSSLEREEELSNNIPQ